MFHPPKKLGFCEKRTIFDAEQADKFIQSFSLSGIQYSIKINLPDGYREKFQDLRPDF